MTDSQGRIAVPENLVGKRIYLECGGYRGSITPNWGETEVVLAGRGTEAGGGGMIAGIALGLAAVVVVGFYRLLKSRGAG
jgi:putative transposon-encoded protein